MQRGLHFRLDHEEVVPVLDATGDDDALEAAVSALEENPEIFARGCETDKAWDPITCALAPAGDDAPWPARGVIGGARALQGDDDAAWVTHCSPEEAAEVADYLASLSDSDFTRAYRAMPIALRNPEYGSEELAYAVANLTDLREFFRQASHQRQHVVFSVWG